MLRTKPDTLDTFIVFDVTEPLHASLCKGEAEAREMVTYFRDQKSVRVHRVTLGELARDVTADFLPDDDEADDGIGIPSPDSLRRWHEGRVL